MSSDQRTIAAKLLESAAAKSLASEHTIAKVFAAHGWYANHGTYYTDPHTGKTRELDVVASQRWLASRENGKRAVGLINVLVESKSAAGFHLLFAPTLQPPTTDRLRNWNMTDQHVATAVLQALVRGGLRDDHASNMKKAFFKTAWDHDREGDLVPVAPHIEVAVSSFRETNVGTDKELDNSVLWRAIQVLSSAVSAFHASETDDRAEEIRFGMQLELMDGRKPAPFVLSEMSELLGFAECYHSVVVTDSELWLVEGDTLRNIPWCRLYLRDKSHIGTGSYDVVHSSRVDAYVRLVTEDIGRQMKHAGATQLRRSDGEPAA